MVINVGLLRLRRMPYHKVLTLQYRLFDQLKHTFENKPGYLLLVEHDPVYTIGLRDKHYNEDYENKLRRRLNDYGLSADFVRTNRGGLVTFHGPGQLVAYPIINLRRFQEVKNSSLKRYVALLEATIIRTLLLLGLPGAHTIREHPGVWIGSERKIAAVGIHCNRYITMHGLSINCNCDLSWFDHIISCGIEGKTVTSLCKELNDNRITTLQVIPKFTESFEKHFNCRLIDCTLNADVDQR
ncbi:putative lipoyltransferase 2, mitochondrial, partial [Fragariocoptes setiger]